MEMNYLSDIIEPIVLEPPFQLEESWFKKTVGILKSRINNCGFDGILLKNPWNILYFSGLSCWTTERPFWLFVPAKGEPSFYYPALDKELIDTWWINDGAWYFDYPHCGPYNQTVFQSGEKQDLFVWLLENLAERGFSKARIGIDTEFSCSENLTAKKSFPEMKFETAADICLQMRQIKSDEEIQLISNAIYLQDHLLEYARRLIIEFTSRITDFAVQHEVKRYGTELLMKYCKVDGSLHKGTGIDMAFTCRAGKTTAFPHPNQFYYHTIERGDPIQLAGFIHIGGYVGEGYRALHVNPITAEQLKMWEVHTEMANVQTSLMRPGVLCSEVCSKVLEVAERNGMEKYVFHRPAHGIGMEGHQPPFIALADHTPLEENMVFSNEPGLYDPASGYGYNHSNTILVTRNGGKQINTTPMTKEWCFLNT
jgi:Xaa-Pro dipeptidase